MATVFREWDRRMDHWGIFPSSNAISQLPISQADARRPPCDAERASWHADLAQRRHGINSYILPVVVGRWIHHCFRHEYRIDDWLSLVHDGSLPQSSCESAARYVPVSSQAPTCATSLPRRIK